MFKPFIACDADGVFIDWNGLFLSYANARLGTDRTYDDYRTHNLYETFDTDPVTIQQLVDDFDDEHCRREFPLVEGAEEYAHILGRRYRFAIVTSCPDSYKSARYSFFKKLLPDSLIFFSSGKNNTHTGREGRQTKLEIVRSIPAVAFIDDNVHEFPSWDPDVALPLCYSQPWNRALEQECPFVPRLIWPEIAELLLV